MAANMDGVGEFGVAEKLSEYGMTRLTKQHDVKIKQYKKIKSIYPNIAVYWNQKKTLKI